MYIISIREVEALAFRNNRHIMVVIFSRLRTGRLYPPGNTHFNYRPGPLQGHSAARNIMSIAPSGIEPATFRLIVRYLNKLCHRIQPSANNSYVIAILGRDNFLIFFTSHSPFLPVHWHTLHVPHLSLKCFQLRFSHSNGLKTRQKCYICCTKFCV